MNKYTILHDMIIKDDRVLNASIQDISEAPTEMNKWW